MKWKIKHKTTGIIIEKINISHKIDNKENIDKIFNEIMFIWKTYIFTLNIYGSKEDFLYLDEIFLKDNKWAK